MFVKLIGAIMGAILIILHLFGAEDSFSWVVGMFLVWGYIYSLKD